MEELKAGATAQCLRPKEGQIGSIERFFISIDTLWPAVDACGTLATARRMLFYKNEEFQDFAGL